MNNDRKNDILQFFAKFPAASRDQLARLFFAENTDPTKKCTMFMKELRKEGFIEVNAEKRPYVYFSRPLRIKKKSAILDHHLALVDLYIELTTIDSTLEIRPEVNFGKGYPRSDLVIRLNDKWYFTEVQRTKIKTRKMQEKIDQYYDLFLYSKHEEICDEFTVLVVSDHEYEIKSHLPVIQVKSAQEILEVCL